MIMLNNIPEKFRTQNLFIRPYKDFCRTCIITDSEITKLTEADLEFLLSHQLF